MQLLQIIHFTQRMSFMEHCRHKARNGIISQEAQTLWVNLSGNFNRIRCGNILIGGRDGQNNRIRLQRKDTYVNP